VTRAGMALRTARRDQRAAGSSPSTVSGNVFASTFAYHFTTLPSGPITQATRRAYFAFLSSAAPYAIESDLSASLSSANGNEFLSLNALLSAGVSNETPTRTAFFSANFWLRSRKPQPSTVQPGVSALA
jgi:hypothetical protein